MGIAFDLSRAETYLGREELERANTKAAELCRALYEREDTEGVLGWRTKEESVLQLDEIKAKAEEVRKRNGNN